jgi:predicted unusual protein kinase regulating ubiquinone biosynthesis (AarF/ABC1/UbiB family)
MGKRDELKRLTTSWAGRTLASGRVAAHLGKAAAGKVLKVASAAADTELGEALAGELDAMKGLAMKVGQMASYLEGSVPPGAQRMLQKLQQGGEPMALERLRPQIEEALGGTLEALFDRFEEEPLASASIAQVHRATLSGEEVVVKVQYPEIARTFEIDLGHLHRLTRLAGLGASFDANEIVGELRARLMEECDFLREADNQAVFRRIWADTPWVVVPEVKRERTARTVLTSVYAPGERFSTFVDGQPQPARDRAGAQLFSFAFGSIFAHALLHGDPHPGNYLFDGERVVFLDFGCVRYFPASFVETWKVLAWATLEDRRPDLRDAMVATGMVPDPDRYDFDYHWQVMRYLYEPFLAPRFRYTHEYVQRSWKLLGSGNPNMRRTRMPPEWVLTNRLQWGLNSVLAHLGSEADFGTLFRAALSRPTVPALP